MPQLSFSCMLNSLYKSKVLMCLPSRLPGFEQRSENCWRATIREASSPRQAAPFLKLTPRRLILSSIKFPFPQDSILQLCEMSSFSQSFANSGVSHPHFKIISPCFWNRCETWISIVCTVLASLTRKNSLWKGPERPCNGDFEFSVAMPCVPVSVYCSSLRN